MMVLTSKSMTHDVLDRIGQSIRVIPDSRAADGYQGDPTYEPNVDILEIDYTDGDEIPVGDHLLTLNHNGVYYDMDLNIRIVGSRHDGGRDYVTLEWRVW